MDKLDICIFMSDQHNADFMGCAGNKIVRTPNLDKIAKKGVQFNSAYTACPLCVPARTAFLTTRLPHSTQVYTNADSLRSDILTFPYILGANDYETTLVGRMHFVGEDQRHGFEHRKMKDFNPIWGRSGQKRADLGPYVMTPVDDIDKLVGGGTSPVLEYDRQVIKEAVNHFPDIALKERPQLTVVGTLGPHHPFVAPVELYEYYKDIVDRPPDWGKSPDYTHPVIDFDRDRVNPDSMPDIRAAYYGMIEQIDNQVGAVYEAFLISLKDRGTKGIFIYLSDHGDQAGQLNMYRKETFFEGSSRIPLIICGEGIEEGITVNKPVSIMDIGVTICDLLNIDKFPVSDGRSFLEGLRGNNLGDDRMAISQYNLKGAPGVMVRWRNYKYITYYKQEAHDLLFDLEKDPCELHNTILEHPEIAKKLRKEALTNWDGEEMLRNMKFWQKQHSLLSKWGGNCPMPYRDFWHVPKECLDEPYIR
jgi:choline-sulfatase